jgi:hypothetical protein
MTVSIADRSVGAASWSKNQMSMNSGMGTMRAAMHLSMVDLPAPFWSGRGSEGLLRWQRRFAGAGRGGGRARAQGDFLISVTFHNFVVQLCYFCTSATRP